MKPARGRPGRRAQLIASDLRQTSELVPLPPNQKDYYSYPEVTAPTFSKWRASGRQGCWSPASSSSRSDGRLTFGCYVYDVETGRELGRKGFVGRARRLAPGRAQMLGRSPTRPRPARPACSTPASLMSPKAARGDARVKRIAVMDSDGYNHRYRDRRRHDRPDPAAVAQGGDGSLTSATPAASRRCGSSTSIPASSARWSPGDAMTFAPRFSPDGQPDRCSR